MRAGVRDEPKAGRRRESGGGAKCQCNEIEVRKSEYIGSWCAGNCERCTRLPNLGNSQVPSSSTMQTFPFASTVIVTALEEYSEEPRATRTLFFAEEVLDGGVREPHATSLARSWNLTDARHGETTGPGQPRESFDPKIVHSSIRV